MKNSALPAEDAPTALAANLAKELLFPVGESAPVGGRSGAQPPSEVSSQCGCVAEAALLRDLLDRLICGFQQ